MLYALYWHGQNVFRDLYLETSAGVIGDERIDGYGYGNKFVFEGVNTDDDHLILNIPYILVESKEHKNIKLTVPDSGRKEEINQVIEFDDAVMTIVDTEKVFSEDDEKAMLKMTIQYHNKLANMQMMRANFTRLNFWGMTQSGSYSATIDQNGLAYNIVYIDLKQDDKGTIRFQVSNPLYFVTDEYRLNLKP